MDHEDIGGFEVRYRAMSELELMELAREYDSLIESAQAALRAEFQRRSLEPPLLDESVRESGDTDAPVTVNRYRDLTEAFVARSVLEAAGIPCFLCDENFVRLYWGYSNFIGGMRLQVPGRFIDDALALLTEKRPGSIEVPGEPIFIQPVCPRCGSDDVVAYDPGLKTAALGALIGIPTRISSHSASGEAWHCMNCALTWTDEQDSE